MQGIWVEACRGLAELAGVMGDTGLAEKARGEAARTQAAIEKTYWLGDRAFYAFATALAKPEKDYKAEAGPRRAERQARIDALRGHTIVDEDTVLPGVPLWWRVLDPVHADAEIDHLGSAALAADWGQRLLSEKSELYDPLSYHYGSVWPLFTGWASVGAYQYGRPQVGYRALMANALLTWPWALGYVTELLSGEFHAPFGRSSHHQVWSEAMVVSPLVRGLFGIEVSDAGQRLRFAPQLPADWDRAAVRRVAAGASRVDFAVERAAGRMTITATAVSGPLPTLALAPALPLDAHVQSVRVDGADARFRARPEGDVQRIEIDVPKNASATRRVVLTYEEGTDVFAHIELPEAGSVSEGLRVLRARVEGGALRLLVEGRAGRSYVLGVRTPRRVNAVAGVKVTAAPRGAEILVAFDGVNGQYVRRSIALPLN
jgi:hypothetical protein